MIYSEIDPTFEISASRWAVSLLVTKSFILGHTLVAVEGILGSTHKRVYAHLVPHSLPGTPWSTQKELLKGIRSDGHPSVGKVRLVHLTTNETFRTSIRHPFVSKTWGVAPGNAIHMLDRMNIDALRGEAGVELPLYNMQLLGQLTQQSPETRRGLNCANWSQMMLHEASIQNQGGLLFDFPRTQAWAGNRSDWGLWGMAAVLGLTVGVGMISAANGS